jgi:hypothetical protein
MNFKQHKKRKLNHSRDDEKKLQTTVTLRDVCPDRIFVPLRYCHRSMQSGAVTKEQVFAINSLFDPDFTGAGHQPLGYDQWCAFYNRYRVDKVKVDIDFINGSGTLTDCLVVANNESTAINTQATFTSAAEAAFSWNRMCSPINSNGQLHMTQVYDLAQITGIERAKYVIDDSYQSVNSTSPTEGIYLHVVTQANDFATAISCEIRVRLTLFSSFWDKNQLTQS